jgi:hypothetical protein
LIDAGVTLAGFWSFWNRISALASFSAGVMNFWSNRCWSAVVALAARKNVEIEIMIQMIFLCWRRCFLWLLR